MLFSHPTHQPSISAVFYSTTHSSVSAVSTHTVCPDAIKNSEFFIVVPLFSTDSITVDLTTANNPLILAGFVVGTNLLSVSSASRLFVLASVTANTDPSTILASLLSAAGLPLGYLLQDFVSTLPTHLLGTRSINLR